VPHTKLQLIRAVLLIFNPASHIQANTGGRGLASPEGKRVVWYAAISRFANENKKAGRSAVAYDKENER